MIRIKTLKQLREMDISKDCPRLENLPNTINPLEYYDYIQKVLSEKWISVDSLKKEIMDIRQSIIDEEQFEHLCFVLDEELDNNYGGSYGKN